MPALDFSDLLEDEQPPATAPAPLDFSDLLAEPAAAPAASPISFDDLVGDVADLPPGSGQAPSLDPATYLKGAAPSFQMTPANEDQFPEMTAAMEDWVGKRKAAGTWANVNEPLLTEAKRKEYSDWLAENEAKIPPVLDVSGVRSLLELKLGPEKAKEIRSGVVKGAAELAYGFTSPLGIGTLGMGILPKAVQKAAAIGFTADMVRHLPEAVEAIGNATTTEEKSKAITSAIGSAGMISLLATHAGGRPVEGGAGSRVVGSEGPRMLVSPAQIAALEKVAPATAEAISAVETPPVAPNAVPEPAEAAAAPIIKAAPEEPAPFVAPETSTILDPTEFPAAKRPMEGLEVSMKDLPQFKGGADPVTGEVVGQELAGKWDPLAAGNITEWVRDVDPKTGERLPPEQWRRIVASGRHRYQLAKRTGQTGVNTQQVFESQGWDRERVHRLDAELNIKDQKGTVHDFANYFRGNPEGAAGAAERGLLARTEGKRGHQIGTLASDDLYARFQAEKLSEQHAFAIVQAVGDNAGAQRVGMKYADANPRATMEEVANRAKAATLVEAAPDAQAQGELWDSGDATMAAMDKAAEAAAEFQRQKRDDVRTLQAALGKSQELKLTPGEAQKFGVRDPNSVISIRQALERVRNEADAWDNWHLNPEMRDAVLEKSGTKQQLSSQPKPADTSAPKPVGGRRIAKIAIADSKGRRVAEGELGREHQELVREEGNMAKLLEAGDDPFSAQHGFLDEDGNWMSRTEGWEVAKASGVLDTDFVAREEARAKAKGVPPELHSQHLQKPTEEASFFEQMGMDQPAKPLPEPERPAERPTAKDVVFSEVNHPDIDPVSKAKVGSSTGTFVEHPDRIELKDLVSIKQGDGGGSAIIEALKAKGKPIELVAGRRATDTPIEQLTRFYRNRGFREVEGSPGHFRWEPNKVELSKASQTRGDQLVNVDPAAFDAAFKKDPSMYVGPKGEGGIKGRYEGFVEWLKKGLPVEASEVTVNPNGSVAFTNGRHRYAYFRDSGRTEIPMAMDAASIENARKNGLLAEKTSPEGAENAVQPSKTGADVVQNAARPLPQAAGASNIRELQQQQAVFAGEVYSGLERAEGTPPERDVWERNFLRHYPELEGDVAAIDRNWTMAQEAGRIFREAGGNKPMSAIIGELEGELRGLGVTGIKNRQADIVRRERGLPAAFQQARRAFGRVWDEAMRRIDDDPQLQDRLVERLRKDPMAIVEDWETAALLQRQIDLENRFDSSVDAVNRAIDSGDANARTVAMADARVSQDALIEILDLNKQSGTALGRGLAARKLMGRRDYTLERMISETRAQKGEELTDAERTAVEQEHETIQRTDADLELLEAKREQTLAEQHADEAIKDLKKQAEAEGAEGQHEPLVASIAERIYQRLKTAALAAEERIKERRKSIKFSSTPIEIGMIRDYAILAAEAIARGIRSFGKWRSEIHEKYGADDDVYLQRAWNEGDKLVEQSVNRAAPREKRAAVGSAVKKLDPTQVREKAAGSMKKKFAKDPKLSALRPYVQKIALAFVRDGITERESLVDAVHTLVKEAAPDATRRQTMDLISGYGDFSPLDMETAKVQLRDIKGELQQVAKIEDIKAKQPLQMTGVERRKKGGTERRLEQEVNETKRKYGVVVTDPDRQLKSAIDGIHTRLKHQIEDLTHTIETGKKPTDKTKVEYDATADKLVAVRDRLRATLEELEGKPEMTDAQRVQIAMKSVEASIAEYDRRIAEKDFSGERASKAPASDQLDAMKARRDALKAEFEELRAADENWREEQAFDSLMKQADAVASKIASGNVAAVRPGAKPADTALVAQARARLEGLRRQLSAARAATPEARQAKIDAAVKAVERSIEDYTKRLETGEIDPQAKKSGATSPELDALRKERDELRKIVTDLRNYAKPKLSPDEIALRSLKTRLTRSNAEIRERTLAGDFAKRPVRKVDLSKDPEAVKLKAENIRAKKEFEKRKQIFERKNLEGIEKAWANTAETINAHRAIVTSFDFSGVLRQGGMLTTGVGNQGHTIRAMKAMFEAGKTQEGFDRMQAELELRDNAKNGNYDVAKLFLAEQGDVRLTAREEAYLSNWAERIPGVGGSQRAYVAFLNRLRADKFDAMHDSLTRGSWFRRKGEATKKELQAIANFVNIATGRGDLGKAAPAAEVLATLLFSPRLLASRFQLLAGQPMWGGTMRTRALIAKEYAKTLTGLGLILGLGSMMGANVGMNPNSSDFGKLVINNTRVDMLFGLSQVTTLLSRLQSGMVVGPDGKAKNEHESPVGKFLRSKFAPIPGAIWDARDIIVTGKAPKGHPQTLPELGLSFVSPLSFGELLPILEDNGVPRGTALYLLSLFGAGVNVHDDTKKKK